MEKYFVDKLPKLDLFTLLIIIILNTQVPSELANVKINPISLSALILSICTYDLMLIFIEN